MSCHTCLDGPCNSEYHASVRRLRQWLLNRVDVVPMPMPVPRQAPRQFVSGLGDIHSLRSPSSRKKARK